MEKMNVISDLDEYDMNKELVGIKKKRLRAVAVWKLWYGIVLLDWEKQIPNFRIWPKDTKFRRG